MLRVELLGTGRDIDGSNYPRVELLRVELLGTGRDIDGSNYPRVELSMNRSVQTSNYKGTRATEEASNVAKICAQNRTCLFPTHDVRISPAQLT